MTYRVSIVALLVFGAMRIQSFAESVPYKDAKAGFELAYPKGVKIWKDTEPDNHLAIGSPDDGLMVFVNSNVFNEVDLPKTETALVPWARGIYDHEDPAYRLESCAVVELPAGKCVKTIVVMTPKSGEVLIAETCTFVDCFQNRSHRRVWKVFAILPKKRSAEKSAEWQDILRTVRIYSYE